jgi:dolichol-phosphate mannosyltransferase
MQPPREKAGDPSVALVALTYNERENLPEFVKRIFVLRVPNLTLYIVDDNSPDGTGHVADELAMHFPIEVIHRPQKEGVGPAYRDAFHRILSLASPPDFIFEIDADLSHNPADIPRMLETCKNVDIVIGSRYIPDGGIRNWSRLRRTISRFGNMYAGFVLHPVDVRDLTSGFKCYRKDALSIVAKRATSSIGYNFQIETVYTAFRAGLRIREIPIIFSERRAGVSKFKWRIIVESFWRVLLLRLRG